MDYVYLTKKMHQQNFLSFQNIPSTQVCEEHLSKKAKYRNRSNNLLYCNSCSIQLASQGIPVEPLQDDNFIESIEQNFIKIQKEIKKEITSYTNAFDLLIETLTDIQIKDLMNYNKLLDENQRKFRQKKLDFKNVDQQIKRKIMSIQKFVNRIVENPMKSYETNFTTNITNNASQTSSLTIKQRNFLSVHKNTQSLNQSIQDTPESIKSKLSIKRFKPSEPIGMFERIDVCESIDNFQQTNKKQNQNDKSLRSEYRYGRTSLQ